MRTASAKTLLWLAYMLAAVCAHLSPLNWASAAPAKKFKPTTITGPSYDDAVNRADAIAEIEVIAVVPATLAGEGALEARVRKQAGLVKLPDRLHLVLPRREQAVIADPDDDNGVVIARPLRTATGWLNNLTVGQRLVLPITAGDGGRLWNVEPTAPQGSANWSNIEEGFTARRELNQLRGDDRDRRLAEMLVSPNMALARLALAELAETDEVPQSVSQALLQLDDGRFNQVFASLTITSSGFVQRALEKRSAKELITLVQGKSTAGRRTVAAREALIVKSQAGDSDAVAFWIAELNRAGAGATNLRFAGRGLQNAGASDPKARAGLIARVSALTARDFYDAELLTATLNAGPEGFELVVEILTGKSKIPPRQVGGNRVFPRMALALCDPQHAARLTTLLGDSEPNVRGFAALGLAAIGHLPAAAKIRALYDNPTEDALVRASAAEALCKLGGTAGQAFAESVLAQPENEMLMVPIANRGRARIDLQGMALQMAAQLDNAAGAAMIAKFVAARSDDTTEQPPIGARRRNRQRDLSVITSGSLGSAMLALSLMQHPDAARVAGRIVESRPTTHLAELAVRALVAQDTEAARAELERLAGKLDGEARESVARALLGGSSSPAMDTSTKAAEQVVSDFVRRRDLSSRTPELVRTIGELIEQLDHDEFEVRERATARLAEIGPLARPELLSACRSSAPERAERAFRLMGIIDDPSDLLLVADTLVGLADPKRAGLMVELLASDAPAVRAVLCDGLSAMLATELPYRPLANLVEREKALARLREQLPRLLAEQAAKP